MTGFVALFRKELLELRRTWRFVATVVVFLVASLLPPTVVRIIEAVEDDPVAVPADFELAAVVASTMEGLGTFLAIILAMGALAAERATGTAAMTLSKPVNRTAFVLAKHLALSLALAAALLVSWLAATGLIAALFESPDAGRFLLGVAVMYGDLLFIASIAFFWSSLFTRQLLAGGLAFAVIVLVPVLGAIPGAFRYLPTNASDYGISIIQGEAGEAWPALAIAAGAIPILVASAVAIFRTREL